jgi:hypothetical protein
MIASGVSVNPAWFSTNVVARHQSSAQNLY